MLLRLWGMAIVSIILVPGYGEQACIASSPMYDPASRHYRAPIVVYCLVTIIVCHNYCKEFHPRPKQPHPPLSAESTVSVCRIYGVPWSICLDRELSRGIAAIVLIRLLFE